MKKKTLTGECKFRDADFHGNNAAFSCPECGNLFIVSGMMDKSGRKCPQCGKSKGYVDGGAKSGGNAWIEYDFVTELVKSGATQKSLFD